MWFGRSTLPDLIAIQFGSKTDRHVASVMLIASKEMCLRKSRHRGRNIRTVTDYQGTKLQTDRCERCGSMTTIRSLPEAPWIFR